MRVNREAIVCKCLRYVEAGIEPTHGEFGMSYEQYGVLWEYIRDHELATNISIMRGGRGNKVILVFLNNSRVSEKGYKYLDIFDHSVSNSQRSV